MEGELEDYIQKIELPNINEESGSTKVNKNSAFYCKAQKYWSSVPPTVNGMLGGLGYINTIDINGSVCFLENLKGLQSHYALDCGAGIGRVSKNLLIPRFEKVDLVEQDENFAKAARKYCTNSDAELSTSSQIKNSIGNIYNTGLQEFSPDPNKYNVIWSQWVLGHLTDDDLLDFYIRVKKGLTKDGFFVMKENVTSSKSFEVDEIDSSVTRPLKAYECILKRAGYRIVKIERQQHFPKGLYPVYMIACRPIVDIN